jgi:hypothetical protein
MTTDVQCVCAERVTICAPARHHGRVPTFRLLASLAALLAVSPASATTPASGLYGTVRKGPITPVCRASQPCDEPAQVTLIFARAGRDVGRTRSGADGRYRISLAPGYYAVRTLERIGIGRSIRPREVHVRRGHVDRLNFSLDTGLR